MINYNLGKDMVARYIAGAAGDDPSRRWAAFIELLASPRLPSSLTATGAAPLAASEAGAVRCIEIAEPGGPEVLRLAERPDPVPAAGELLIDVVAAGVNRPDVLQRQGAYPPPPGASDIPGLEVAGHVAAVAAGVRRTGAWATRCARWSLAAATPAAASRRRRSACRCRRA